MSLPSEGVNANALTETTAIPTGKKLIFLDPDTNEGGIITLENLTKQILSNLVTQTFDLDQGTKTLLTALNELNSKPHFVRIFTADTGDTVVLTPSLSVDAYHFSAFCYGEKNGEYAFAIICSVSQKAEGCSVTKTESGYEIRMNEWSGLSIISPWPFSCSIK